MKKETHPKYYKDAKVKCACGNTMTIGSTEKEIEVEICSNCHPFYTGDEQLIDTAGRAEKFKKRRESAKKTTKEKAKDENKSKDKEKKTKEEETKTAEMIKKANKKLNK